MDVGAESVQLVGLIFEKASGLPADEKLDWLCGVLAATLWW